MKKYFSMGFFFKVHLLIKDDHFGTIWMVAETSIIAFWCLFLYFSKFETKSGWLSIIFWSDMLIFPRRWLSLKPAKAGINACGHVVMKAVKESNCRDRVSTELCVCLQNFRIGFVETNLILNINYCICRYGHSSGFSTVQNFGLVLSSHRHSRLPITLLPLSVPAVSLADVQDACADGECSIVCSGTNSCRDSVFSCPEEHECLRECSIYSCGGSEMQGPGINGTLCECICLQIFRIGFVETNLILNINYCICRYGHSSGFSTVRNIILVLTSHRHSRLPITPLPLSVPAVSLADVQGACADGECSIECSGQRFLV